MVAVTVKGWEDVPDCRRSVVEAKVAAVVPAAMEKGTVRAGCPSRRKVASGSWVPVKVRLPVRGEG